MDEMDEANAPLWHHIGELRATVLRIFCIVGAAVVLCFINYNSLISLLQTPLHPDMTHLVLLGPLEGILVAMKVSFWTGIVVSSPLWLWMFMRFVTPGLRLKEQKLTLSFILISVALIAIGGAFAFFITIPLANNYLFSFNQNVGVNLWSLENYLNYSLFLILANGAAFELGAIGIFAVRLGFLTTETLVAKRRHAILGAFIVATLLTPPDVLTQLLLAFPLIGLYEGLIVYARLRRSYLGM
ncbi:MAG: twin-arginine translocase subunit TatC [Parachlamydiaceae bacterium]